MNIKFCTLMISECSYCDVNCQAPSNSPQIQACEALYLLMLPSSPFTSAI